MAARSDTILQQFNQDHPEVKLAYELFDFPEEDAVFAPQNMGMIVATFSLGGRRHLLNTVYKKESGLDRIEIRLIARIIKLLPAQ